eukprot:15329150-Ditylum_brightwellii.AAC.1
MQLDKENGNILWFQAQQKEASTLRKMETFQLKPEDFDLTSYQYVPLIYTFGVKLDGCRKACLVAYGKVTIGPQPEDIWS